MESAAQPEQAAPALGAGKLEREHIRYLRSATQGHQQAARHQRHSAATADRRARAYLQVLLSAAEALAEVRGSRM